MPQMRPSAEKLMTIKPTKSGIAFLKAILFILKIFFLRFYLFIHERQREREAEAQAEGERKTKLEVSQF